MGPPLSRAERRLASFCRTFAALYLAGAAIFAFAPTLAYRLASNDPAADLGVDATFFSVLAASAMIAFGVTCLVVAVDVRARRHALLAVVLGKLSTVVLALAHFGAGRALWTLFACDLVVCVATLVVYRMASPGVHLAQQPRETAPPPDEAPAGKVQLGLPK